MAAVVKSESHLWIGFRGTDSEAGEDNVIRMYGNWILEKMEEQIKEQWRLLGFDVTDSHLKSKESDIAPRSMMLFGSPFLKTSSAKRIADAVEGKGMDIEYDRIRKEGYWPLSQAIVRSILPSHRSDDDGRTVIFYVYSNSKSERIFF